MRSKEILGLDLSLCSTGWSNGVSSGIIKTTPKDDILYRLLYIRNSIAKVISKKGTKQCIIEDFSFGSRGKAIFQLGGLGWVVRLMLWEWGIPYLLVAPAVLKKFITGKGNANKELMMECIYKKFGKQFKDDNEADAFALHKWGILNG